MVCGMSSSNAFKPPAKNGVGPSTVGIPASTSLSAIEFLSAKFSAVSSDEWQQRFNAKEILNSDGRVMSPHDSLKKESHIYYYRSVRDEPVLPFKAEVIFQDDHLVVADKPHFMPVTPGGRYVQQSLLVQLKQQLNLPDLSPIHRIDRETAGLVVFSVRANDRGAYQELFRLRQVEKTYEAIACAPETSTLNLKFPLVRRSRLVEDAQFFKMREMTLSEFNDPSEINSETWIDCVERLNAEENCVISKDSVSNALARYTLKPITGQRHQLRVHMSALGLPILNDQFYPKVMFGPDETDTFKAPLKLLAKSIQFKDPVTGQDRDFAIARHLST